MNDLILRDSGTLTISDSDRIRIAAAWEALSANSRRNYQGAWGRCSQWLNDRGMTTDDLSDELMAVYIASLDAEGRTPATITVARLPRSSGFSPMCGTRNGAGRQRRTSCALSVETQRRKGPGQSRTPDL